MTAIDAFAGGPGAKLSTPDWIAEQLRRAILTGAIAGGVQLKQNDANWIESHLTIVTAIRNHDLDEACRLIVEQTLESSDRVQAQLWPARGETHEDDR
jgi:DNA-binding GntR family transcriptional regulator